MAKKYITIASPDDPRLAAYRSLKGKELERDGIFIAEGQKVIASMLASKCRIASCLTAEDTVSRYKALLEAMANRGVSVYVAPKEFIEGIIGFRFHRGIMAVGYCPEKRATAEVLKKPGRGRVLAALNAVNDPENVGLIVRNAAAFGVRALIVDDTTYDPYYRRAVRVSMGTLFDLPVCYERDLAAGLTGLKKWDGTRIIAATPGRGSRDIGGVDLSGNICFVFGNEDTGISDDILKIADARVRIPITRGVDSLNVASASAVCFYAALRDRDK